MLTQRSLSLNAEAGFSHEGTDPIQLDSYNQPMDCPHDNRQILSSRRGLLEGLRTDAAEMTVAPGPVVEHFNVIEDIRPGQIPGFIDAFSDPFFFE